MTAKLLTLAILLCLAAPAVAAEDPCPWLNAATAGGALGGAVQGTVAPKSCEFVRREEGHEITLRIEVTAASAPPAHCEAGAEAVKGIGNRAVACSYKYKPGWLAEQVVGTVRDQALLVRIATNNPSVTAKALRDKARNVAEQVAGNLF
ncbi:MAG TPA: hypothetical protein VME43_02915 [Bryobacteraceae bacterium]|nr:hypothetical protein [Bryobacteraceae bacterium]